MAGVVKTIDDETTQTESVHPASLGLRTNLSLLVLSGPDAGRWFTVPAPGGVIGRHVDALVRLADPAVSRQHCRIEVGDGNEVLVHDLGSRNGVHIDGERVTSRGLDDGDRIQLTTETMLRVRFIGTTETEIMGELQRAAITDALTGAHNRRYLTTRLDEELSYARRHGVPVSVLMIDLDNFKQVNDSEGHQRGDAVLKEIAGVLLDTVRREDVVARYGGDEFCVLARGYPIDKAMQFAARLREVVKERAIGAGQAGLYVTLSIGLAGYDPMKPEDRGLSPMELLTRADAALYETKRSGRDGARQWPEGRTSDPPPTPERSRAATDQAILPPTLVPPPDE
jgi:diguanylate cyclase (GGDEF)-like protein